MRWVWPPSHCNGRVRVTVLIFPCLNQLQELGAAALVLEEVGEAARGLLLHRVGHTLQHFAERRDAARADDGGGTVRVSGEVGERPDGLR